MTAVVGPVPYNANTGTMPAFDCFTITQSDTVNEDIMFRALYVGVGGDVVVVTPSGNVVQFTAVPQGIILPVMGLRVNDTTTTASGLVGLI